MTSIILVSVDPGKHQSACVAWAETGHVLWCCLQNYPLEPIERAGVLVPVVCELMRVYEGGSKRMTPSVAEDLIMVSIGAGRVCANYPDTMWVPAGTWKGQVPKKVHHKTRILPRLTAKELALVCDASSASLRHNILDAVGIGLWYLDCYFPGLRKERT